MELERDILIDARPETVYELLTVADRHRLWQGTEVELDPTPGGIYRVVMAGEYPAQGSFVEVVPNEKLVFTFGWDVVDNPITPGSTTVEITLAAEGDKTRVRLRHSGLPDSDAVTQHTHGWDHYLARLDTVSRGGEAGPDSGPGDG